MKFDVVIIRRRASGLTLRNYASTKRKCCTIINNGQSAMNFSSGSMDLLSQYNGEKINSFEQGYDSLNEEQLQIIRIVCLVNNMFYKKPSNLNN